MKEEKVDHNIPQIGGVWYYPAPKNKLYRFFCEHFYPFFSYEYIPFRDIEKAKKCVKLLNKGEWEYKKKVEVWVGGLE